MSEVIECIVVHKSMFFISTEVVGKRRGIFGVQRRGVSRFQHHRIFIIGWNNINANYV